MTSTLLALREDDARVSASNHAVQRNICFGRMDTGRGKSAYVGRLPPWDERGQLILVSGMAESAKPFYEARRALGAGPR